MRLKASFKRMEKKHTIPYATGCEVQIVIRTSYIVH